MRKRWRIHPHDRDRIDDLCRGASVPPLIAQLLLARGLDQPEAIELFLSAKLTSLRDPMALPGVAEASARLHAALLEKRRIVVYGDYDVDGMAATALLSQCLRLLGGNVGTYVPNRLDEGYGLNEAALRTLAAQGAATVVTVDCGIASPAEAEVAAQLGIELIITDHHQLGPMLPRAAALVHPGLPGTGYPFQGLCGAGVAFKLAWAVGQQASGAQRVGQRMRDFLVQAVALAGLGAIADVVPLVDENRVLVRHGLASLRGQPTVGLAAILKHTGLDERDKLDAEDVAFQIAPRLNAAGRLGQAQLGVELLTTNSPERAAALAEYLGELNSSRQSLERSVYLAAHKQAREQFDPVNDAALVLAGRGWHPGVIGIVAGRLAEKYHRPVVLLALDELGVKPAAGSARSVPGINLHEALAQCDEHLLSHGGHAAAAGLKLDESNLDAFRTQFCECIAVEQSGDATAPELWIDAEATFSSFSHEVVAQIERLAPFGHGNRRPVFCATNVRLEEPPKRIGGGGQHLSLRLSQHGHGLRAVAFGNGDWVDELPDSGTPFSVAFQPTINHFRGRHTVELHLRDWQLHETEDEVGALQAARGGHTRHAPRIETKHSV